MYVARAKPEVSLLLYNIVLWLDAWLLIHSRWPGLAWGPQGRDGSISEVCLKRVKEVIFLFFVIR